MDSIRVTAKTVEDAITEASIQLGTSSDNIEYTVIDKGSSGFFGIGGRKAVIEAKKKFTDEDLMKEVFGDKTEKPKKEFKKENRKESRREASKESSKESFEPKKEAKNEAKNEAKKEAGRDNSRELSKEPAKEVVKEASKESSRESSKDVSREVQGEKAKEASRENSETAKEFRKEKKDERRDERREGSREHKKEYAKESRKEASRETAKASAKDNVKAAEKESPKAPAQEKEKEETPKTPRVPANPEEAKRRAETFLKDLFHTMEMNVEISTVFEDDTLSVDISGDDMGILIGKRGQTLDSLQYLTSLVVNKGKASYVRVKLDTEDYRNRRKATLENLARNIAFKVKKTRRPVFLEPMNPYERRIIHSALQNDPYVTTHSEGDEPCRKVVVTLRKDRNRQ